MSYTDDGITLDYDLLRSYYPPQNSVNESQNTSSQKNEKIDVVNNENEKGNKKHAKSANMRSMMKKTSTIHYIASEEQETVLNSSTENLKEDGRKSLTRSESKRAAKELKNIELVRKKLKIEGVENESKLENDETEFDSTKETTAHSTISEIKEQIQDAVNLQAIPKTRVRKPPKRGKKNKREKKLVFKACVIERFDEEKKANYLINPIPNFFEKFKTENIYFINRSFYFDPINLSLSN